LLLFPDEIPGDLPEKLVGEYVCVCERERGRERERQCCNGKWKERREPVIKEER